jgi:hypothetical protein
MAVKIEFMVFWIFVPYSVVVGYQYFKGLCCLSLQGCSDWYLITTPLGATTQKTMNSFINMLILYSLNV